MADADDNGPGTRVPPEMPEKIRVGDLVQVGPDNAVVARGIATSVRTAASAAKMLSRSELGMFIAEKQASFGPNWRETWYEVCVGFRWYDAPRCTIVRRGSVVIAPTKPLT